MMSMVAIMALLRDHRWDFPLRKGWEPEQLAARYALVTVNHPANPDPDHLDVDCFDTWTEVYNRALTDLIERDWYPLCVIDRKTGYMWKHEPKITWEPVP